MKFHWHQFREQQSFYDWVRTLITGSNGEKRDEALTKTEKGEAEALFPRGFGHPKKGEKRAFSHSIQREGVERLQECPWGLQ
jgi:hypothetical protein